MEKRIRRLISYYVKIFGTNDPFRIARQLGIQIFFQPLGVNAGMYKYLEHTKCIFINSDIEDEKFLTVVMAHELGHAILHQNENCCFMAHKTLLLTSKIERDANLFAATLIITDDMIRAFRNCTLEQFSICSGISKELIRIRIKQ